MAAPTGDYKHPFQRQDASQEGPSKGVLTYVKDAYMGPIVMLRGPKGRYCQFLGITVSSAQICRDAYCIWPRMMPRAELGININLSYAGIDIDLSYAGIDINLSYAGININSKLVLNPTDRGDYLNSIQRLASLADHSLATLAIKHLVSTIILTLLGLNPMEGGGVKFFCHTF